MAAKADTVKSTEHLGNFKEIIWRIQEVERALDTQGSLIEILKDVLKELPDDSEAIRALNVMAEASRNMYEKLGDAENYAAMLCGKITGDNVLYSILLDDLKMYSKPGGLHD